MTRLHGPWEVLGLAPTEDIREIRRAYAAKLKTIDPENDPQAFIKLRNAYERVLADLPDPDSAHAFGENMPLPSAEPLPDASETLPEQDASEQHARAILAILWERGSDGSWLAPDAQQELLSHWQALVDDPQMERLDHADRVERWAAAVIAEASPLSLPILIPAVERFGWANADANVHSSYQVSDIARRYRMLKLLDDAARPGSRHHAAWIELHRPASENYSKPVHPYLVFELIAAMRYAHPQLGGSFDPVRLATWEAHAEDARTAHERPINPNPPSCLARILAVAIVLLSLFGVSFFLAWISVE